MAGPTPTWRRRMAAFSRGALLGARGNSGVILSQMLGAIAGRIAPAGPDDAPARVFAEAMGEATDASYAAVGTPGRGHHPQRRPRRQRRRLAAAEDPDNRLGDVVAAGAKGAREALERTPDQLPGARATPGSSTRAAAGSA